MPIDNPSPKFLEALRWLLTESGQSFTLEASATTFIRSLEGGEWCVGTFSLDGDTTEEVCFSDVDHAITEYVSRVTELNDW